MNLVLKNAQRSEGMHFKIEMAFTKAWEYARCVLVRVRCLGWPERGVMEIRPERGGDSLKKGL